MEHKQIIPSLLNKIYKRFMKIYECVFREGEKGNSGMNATLELIRLLGVC